MLRKATFNIGCHSKVNYKLVKAKQDGHRFGAQK